MDEEEDSACELRSSGASVTPDRLSERKWRTLPSYSGLSSPASDVRFTGPSRPDSAIDSQSGRHFAPFDARSESYSVCRPSNNVNVSTATEPQSDEYDDDDGDNEDDDGCLTHQSRTPIEEEEVKVRRLTYEDHDCSNHQLHEHAQERQWNVSSSQDSPEMGASDDEYILKHMPVQQSPSVVKVQILDQSQDSSDQEAISNHEIPSDLTQFRSRLSDLLDRSRPDLTSTENRPLLNNDEPIANVSLLNEANANRNESTSSPIVTLSEEEFAQRTSALRKRIHNTFQLLCSIGAADGTELRKLAQSRAQSRMQIESDKLDKSATNKLYDMAPESNGTGSAHLENMEQNKEIEKNADSCDQLLIAQFASEPNSKETVACPSTIDTTPPTSSVPPLLPLPPPPMPSIMMLPATARRPPRPPPTSTNSATVHRRRSARSIQPDHPIDSNRLRSKSNVQPNSEDPMYDSTSGWIDSLGYHTIYPERYLQQRFVQSTSPTDQLTNIYERHEYTYPSAKYHLNMDVNPSQCCSPPRQKHNRFQQTVLDGPAMKRLLLTTDRRSVQTQTDSIGSIAGPPPTEPIFRRLRDVGVSTDRFTRARFSSLPPTRSRHVQTSPEEFQRSIGTSVSADELPSDQLLMRRQRLMKLRELAVNKVNKMIQTDQVDFIDGKECDKCLQLEAELKRAISPHLLQETMKQVLVDSRLTLDQLVQAIQQNETKLKSETEGANLNNLNETIDKSQQAVQNEKELDSNTAKGEAPQSEAKEEKSVQVNLRRIERKTEVVQADPVISLQTERTRNNIEKTSTAVDVCIQCDLDQIEEVGKVNQTESEQTKTESQSQTEVDPKTEQKAKEEAKEEQGEQEEETKKENEEEKIKEEQTKERVLVLNEQKIPTVKAQRMKTESSISIQVNGRAHRERAEFKCETKMDRFGAFTRKAELTNSRQIPILVPRLCIEAAESEPLNQKSSSVDNQSQSKSAFDRQLHRQKSISAQNLASENGSNPNYVRSQTPALSESELELTGMRSSSRNSLTTDWCTAEQEQSIEICSPNRVSFTQDQTAFVTLPSEKKPVRMETNKVQSNRHARWYEESNSNVISEISADALLDGQGQMHIPHSVQMNSVASLVTGNGRLAGGGLHCASKVQRQFSEPSVQEPVMESNISLHEPQQSQSTKSKQLSIVSGPAPSAVLDEFDDDDDIERETKPFVSSQPEVQSRKRRIANETSDYSSITNPSSNSTQQPSEIISSSSSSSSLASSRQSAAALPSSSSLTETPSNYKLNVNQPVNNKSRPHILKPVLSAGNFEHQDRYRESGSKPGSRVGFYLPEESDSNEFPHKRTLQSKDSKAPQSTKSNLKKPTTNEVKERHVPSTGLQTEVLETELDDVCGDYWQPASASTPTPDHQRLPSSSSSPAAAAASFGNKSYRLEDTYSPEGSRQRTFYRAQMPSPEPSTSFNAESTTRDEIEPPIEQTLKLNEQPDGTEIVTNITKTSYPLAGKQTQPSSSPSARVRTCQCSHSRPTSACSKSHTSGRCVKKSTTNRNTIESERPLSLSNSNLTNLFKRNRLVFEQLLKTPEPKLKSSSLERGSSTSHRSCKGCRIDSQITMDLPIARTKSAKHTSTGLNTSLQQSMGGCCPKMRRQPSMTASMDDIDKKSMASSHSHSQLSGQFVTSSHFKRTRPTTCSGVKGQLNKGLSTSQQMLSAAGLKSSETDWQYMMQCKCANSSNANVLTNIRHRRMLYLPLTQYETSL